MGHEHVLAQPQHARVQRRCYRSPWSIGPGGVLGSDVLAFNVIYVGAWTLSGWITYLLTRHLTGSTAGALVAGFVYTVATPRLAHYGHFQLAMGFLVPLVLLVLVRFFEAPSLAARCAARADDRDCSRSRRATTA